MIACFSDWNSCSGE